MRIPRRIALTTKLALVCLLAAGALAQAAGFRSDPGEGTTAADKAAAFRVRGHLKGLYPGRTTRLRARVTNTGRSPIIVTRLRAGVHSPTAGCAASTLRIEPFHGRKRVNGHATVTIKLPTRMRSSAPNACQGTRYRLVYSGRAVRA